MLREMRSAKVDEAFGLEFRYAGEGRQGYRLHMLPAGPGELWLGKAPSVRRMGQGSNGDMRKGYDFWMPMMLLRRTGEAPLTSVFAAVHEPYAGQPFVGQVKALVLRPAGELAVAVEVRHGQAVDTIISTGDAAPYTERTTETGIKIRGKLAVVRQVQGKVAAVWLFDGESVSGQDFAITAQAAGYDGELTGATRRADGEPQNALLTSATLPAGDTLRGQWLIATYPDGITQGYEVEHVAKGPDGQTVIVTSDDHGLKIAGNAIAEVYFPKRKLAGKVTFRIGGLASVLQRQNGSLEVHATSPVEVTWPK
jgi:hypothetical protein